MTSISSYFHAKPNAKKLTLLFVAAFIIRALVFVTYVQYEERYKQADSTDYHNCAYLMKYWGGLQRPDNNEMIFWRTPGYPTFLLPFYYLIYEPNPQFSLHAVAQKAALWGQIFLCSLIPLIIFFLALLLTNSYLIAWITAWISVFHLGFVLASTYLLTDGLAALFFYLFLWYYYQSWNVWGQSQHIKKWHILLSCAALSLGVYTWMRPMGIFVALCSATFMMISNDTFYLNLKKIALFLCIFFASVSPWYIRNYNHTEKLFFCPMSGGILQAFCAPKIIRRVQNVPLDKATRGLYVQVLEQTKKEQALLRALGSPLHVSPHLVCADIAWPWILQYPGYAMYDWIVQVCKTLFDLYSSQLVNFVANSYTYDPIEEFLTVKIAQCLYTAPLPWWMRVIAYIEFIFLLLMWIGLFGGLFLFFLQPLYKAWLKKKKIPLATYTWIKAAPIIGMVTFMTGGFGYARLRIPVEPLMIILALMFWIYIVEHHGSIKKV